MHDIEMMPFAAPDEATILKSNNQGCRIGCQTSLPIHRVRPAPIVLFMRIKVDGDAVGMKTPVIGTRDQPVIKCTG